MSSAAELHGDYDLTGVPAIVRGSVVLGLLESAVVLLFSVINLARHLGIDGDLALRRAVDRFERRFRAMEEMGPMDGLTLDEMNARWEATKQ